MRVQSIIPPAVLDGIAVPPVARSTPSTVKTALRPLVNALAEAVICLLEPASLHSTVVNVAIPLPAAVPIFRLVVPRSEPEPPVSARATLRLDGKPTLDYTLGSQPGPGRNNAPPNPDLLPANNPVLRPPVAGHIGLWAKTDSTSYFKDYVVITK